MKYIDSMLEDEVRKTLTSSRIDRLKFAGDQRILDALVHVDKDFSVGYILGCTPEQGEDIYTILVNSTTLCVIEVSRVDPDEKPVIEFLDLKEYVKGANGTRERLMIQMALDMLRQQT